MARRPFTLEGPGGGVQVLELGGGAAVLTVVLEGEALSYALSPEECRSLAQYLHPQREAASGASRAPSGAAGPPRAKQRRAPNGSINYAEYGAAYMSGAAGDFPGGRTAYVAERFGIDVKLASSRIARARADGWVKGNFRVDPWGKPLPERGDNGQD